MAQLRDEMQALTRDVKQLRDDLRGMAEEIRLKLHLAGMEAKDAWNDVEPKLADFEKRAELAAQTASAELRALALDLKSRVQKIRDEI